eukprot:scaffold9928_cov112-Isochrysis_galbana.AAC.11
MVGDDSALHLGVVDGRVNGSAYQRHGDVIHQHAITPRRAALRAQIRAPSFPNLALSPALRFPARPVHLAASRAWARFMCVQAIAAARPLSGADTLPVDRRSLRRGQARPHPVPPTPTLARPRLG